MTYSKLSLLRYFVLTNCFFYAYSSNFVHNDTNTKQVHIDIYVLLDDSENFKEREQVDLFVKNVISCEEAHKNDAPFSGSLIKCTTKDQKISILFKFEDSKRYIFFDNDKIIESMRVGIEKIIKDCKINKDTCHYLKILLYEMLLGLSNEVFDDNYKNYIISFIAKTYKCYYFGSSILPLGYDKYKLFPFIYTIVDDDGDRSCRIDRIKIFLKYKGVLTVFYEDFIDKCFNDFFVRSDEIKRKNLELVSVFDSLEGELKGEKNVCDIKNKLIDINNSVDKFLSYIEKVIKVEKEYIRKQEVIVFNDICKYIEGQSKLYNEKLQPIEEELNKVSEQIQKMQEEKNKEELIISEENNDNDNTSQGQNKNEKGSENVNEQNQENERYNNEKQNKEQKIIKIVKEEKLISQNSETGQINAQEVEEMADYNKGFSRLNNQQKINESVENNNNNENIMEEEIEQNNKEQQNGEEEGEFISLQNRQELIEIKDNNNNNKEENQENRENNNNDESNNNSNEDNNYNNEEQNKVQTIVKSVRQEELINPSSVTGQINEQEEIECEKYEEEQQTNNGEEQYNEQKREEMVENEENHEEEQYNNNNDGNISQMDVETSGIEAETEIEEAITGGHDSTPNIEFIQIPRKGNSKLVVQKKTCCC